MAFAQVIEAPGTTAEKYEEVLREIGISGAELFPGHLVHFAGPVNGGFAIVNVWESKEAADRAHAKVMPARQKLGLPEARITAEFPVYRLAK